MKIRQGKSVRCLAATVLSTALFGVAVAQQEQFPREREQARSCAEVDWNKDMTRNHPRLIDACREVVSAGNQDWARFEARFLRVEADGTVAFSLRDGRDRDLEEVTLDPAPGQVAYIDGRATPFAQLRDDQLVNLYVPEGTYGFATQPGARSEQLAAVRPRERATSSENNRVAQAQPRADRLPTTAGALPWFAVAGLLSLFGAFGLRLTRKD